MARVLVIADCPDFQFRMHCAMKRAGHPVLSARDALAGLQRAVEDAPDCIVVADSLTGLGAADVVARLAAEPATESLPVFRVAADARLELGVELGSRAEGIQPAERVRSAPR